MPKTSTERVWEFRARQRQRQQLEGQQRQHGGNRRGAGRPRGTRTGADRNREYRQRIKEKRELNINCSLSEACILEKIWLKHTPMSPHNPLAKREVTSSDVERTQFTGLNTDKRKIKIESAETQEITIKEELLESYSEIQSHELNDTKTFTVPLTIEKECTEFENEKVIPYKMDKDHERDDADIFVKHVAERLKNYDQNTRTAVKFLFNTILIDADSGKYKLGIPLSSNTL